MWKIFVQSLAYRRRKWVGKKTLFWQSGEHFGITPSTRNYSSRYMEQVVSETILTFLSFEKNCQVPKQIFIQWYQFSLNSIYYRTLIFCHLQRLTARAHWKIFWCHKGLLGLIFLLLFTLFATVNNYFCFWNTLFCYQISPIVFFFFFWRISCTQ